MKKADIYGITGSVLSCIMLFLLLWLVVIPMSNLEKQDDEGIMVSFGDALDGAGSNPTPVTEPTPAKAMPVSTPKPVKQEYMTSTDPNALAIAEKKKKDKKEKEILEKQRLEDLRIANEKKKKEQDAINNVSNAMSGAFGSGGTKGSGTTSGTGTQGNPAGKGTSAVGTVASVLGRREAGAVAEPTEIFQEGNAIVSITVDANGNVIYAKVTGGTISDAQTKRLVEGAAKRTKFTSGNGEVRGTITYKLRYSSN